MHGFILQLNKAVVGQATGAKKKRTRKRNNAPFILICVCIYLECYLFIYSE